MKILKWKFFRGRGEGEATFMTRATWLTCDNHLPKCPSQLSTLADDCHKNKLKQRKSIFLRKQHLPTHFWVNQSYINLLNCQSQICSLPIHILIASYAPGLFTVWFNSNKCMLTCGIVGIQHSHQELESHGFTKTKSQHGNGITNLFVPTIHIT